MTAFPPCPLCGTIGKNLERPGTASCKDDDCPVLTFSTRGA